MKSWNRLAIRQEDDDLVVLDSSRLVSIDPEALVRIDDEMALEVRNDGPLKGLAFYLSEYFDWELGQDETGAVCLVPLKWGPKC